jgi:hypothetical protein
MPTFFIFPLKKEFFSATVAETSLREGETTILVSFCAASRIFGGMTRQNFAFPFPPSPPRAGAGRERTKRKRKQKQEKVPAPTFLPCDQLSPFLFFLSLPSCA